MTADERVLSVREREVLILMAQGLTIMESANRLCVSYHTIANRRKTARDKCGAATTAQAVVYARERGWI